MLRFLGKRKNRCRSCGGGVSYETKAKHELNSPWGIKNFRRGNTYEFTKEEIDYWTQVCYYINNTKYYYFKKI